MYQSIFTDELFMDAGEAIKIIHGWGSQYVDFRGMINGKGIEYQTDDELAELKTKLDKLGLKAGVLQSSLCKVHLPDKERQSNELKKLEGLIRASEVLDCKLVRSFFYWQPYESDPDLCGQLAVRPDLMTAVLDMFAPVAKRAREAGLVIGFENCGVTCDEVFAFLGALRVQEWGLAWDPSNDLPLVARDRWAAHFIKCIKRTQLVHVKAISIVPDMIEVETPWKNILSGLAATGRDIPVSVETHNPVNSKYSHEEASKLCFQQIKSNWPSGVPGSIESAVAGVEFEYQPCPFADDPVRFVVAGLGMGRQRALEISQNPATKLVGVCDVNPAKASEAGEQLNVPFSEDINVFLQDENVEAVYIVTPTGLHCEIAEKCLNAGKHVLVTKPMDVCSESCESAVKLADEKGLLLAVDFDSRFSPEMMELIEASHNGWFGQVLSANLTLYVDRSQDYYNENGGWRGTWRYDGGGAMSNQGIHEVDRMMAVLGMPKRVRGSIRTQIHSIEAEDLGWAEWEYENGMIARFQSTTNFPVPAWATRFEIIGTEGTSIHASGGPEGKQTWWAQKGGEWKAEAPYPQKRRWRNGSDNFANAIRTGDPPGVPGNIGLLSRKILDAIYESARGDGDWVDL